MERHFWRRGNRSGASNPQPLPPLRGRGVNTLLVMGDIDREEFLYKNETASKDIYTILENNARSHRHNPTEAESFLWENIRNSSLGYKFRRQHPISDFIADFVCLKKHLIIEVDGGYHGNPEQIHDDNVRSEVLYKRGFYVLRFTNDEVLQSIKYVLTRISEVLDSIK